MALIEGSPTRDLYVVVGTGAIARRHSRVVRAEGHRVLHVRRFGTVDVADLEGPVVSSLGEAFSQKPVGCIVATAAPDHVNTTCDALAQGLDVLLEKPLALSAMDARPLVELARESQNLVMIAYCLRFRSALERLGREAKAGRIGRPFALRAAVGQFLPDWRPTRDYRETTTARRTLGGGVLLELSHEVDLAVSLLGPAASVSARTSRHSDLEIDVEDTAEVLVEHASGAISNLHLDMTDRASNRSCRLVGTDGTLDWNQESGDLRLFRPEGGWSKLESEGLDAASDMYTQQFRYFETCRRQRHRPSPSIEDGLHVLHVVDAARDSERLGQKVTI